MKTIICLALVLTACNMPHTVPKDCKEQCALFLVDTFTDTLGDVWTNRTWCKCSKTERVAVPVPNAP